MLFNYTAIWKSTSTLFHVYNANSEQLWFTFLPIALYHLTLRNASSCWWH